MPFFPPAVQPAARPFWANVAQAQTGDGTVVNILEIHTEVGVFDFVMAPENAVSLSAQLAEVGKLGQLWSPGPQAANGKPIIP